MAFSTTSRVGVAAGGLSADAALAFRFFNDWIVVCASRSLGRPPFASAEHVEGSADAQAMCAMLDGGPPIITCDALAARPGARLRHA